MAACTLTALTRSLSRRPIAASLLLAGLLLAAPAARAEIVDGVAAIVNDDVITLSEVDSAGAPIYQEIKRRFGDASQPEIARARREVLDQLVNQKLMEQVIEKYDITASEGEVDAAIEDVKRQNGITQADLLEALDREGITYDDYREQVTKQIQRSKLMRRQVRGTPEASDADARKYYDDNPALFQLGEEALVRHILIATPASASDEERAEAKKKAEAALGRLKAGEDFGELAKKVSAGPTAGQGGSLGYIRRGDTVPDFEAAVFSMNKGETSGVVETKIGYHVIRVEDKKPARTIPFAEAKESIRRRIVQEEIDKDFQKWLDKLRSNAYVEKKL